MLHSSARKKARQIAKANGHTLTRFRKRWSSNGFLLYSSACCIRCELACIVNANGTIDPSSITTKPCTKETT